MILPELHDAKVFSKVDLREGYHQLELHPKSRHITAFATHVGVFRYKRLIFGKNSAFEIFQKQIEIAITDCSGSKNISDDILIWGKNQKEHDENLHRVLQRLNHHSLRLNKDKCIFSVKSITFAGHRLTDTGISPEKSKIEAITAIKEPTNTTETRSFLGLIGFCQRFIQNYAVITAPLRHLTKKQEPFVWGEEQKIPSPPSKIHFQLTRC